MAFQKKKLKEATGSIHQAFSEDNVNYTNVIDISADVMRQRGAKHILAVDVGSEDTNNFTQYGDYLSGYRVKDYNYYVYTYMDHICFFGNSVVRKFRFFPYFKGS